MGPDRTTDVITPGLPALLGVALLALSLQLAPVSSAPPIIDSPWGRLSGKDVASPSGTVYSAYLGIPFALPPVGERRWAKPVAHPGPGAGRVFNASALGFICPQTEGEMLPDFPAQSEDCLTLNVYVPATPRSGLRSVMVWIYGGGFTLGSAAGYQPSRIVTDGDVIVVVLQYRIGILGFLSTGDDVIRGNFGLFDQTLALKWVKANIRAFGGDPDTVTVFGESAGAGSIAFHLLSPYSKGLFTRAVQQSGTTLASWAINKKPDHYFYKLAERTGCRDQDWVGSRKETYRTMSACLKTLSVDKLLAQTVWAQDSGQVNFFDAMPWTPVVDRDFVPRPPLEMLNDVEYLLSTGVLDKDIVIGVNNNEGGYVVDLLPPPTTPSPGGDDGDMSNDVFQAFGSFDALDENFENLLLTMELKYWYPELEQDKRRLTLIRDVVNFFYLKPLKDGKVEVQALADTLADAFFTVGAVRTAKFLAAAHVKYPSRGRVFLYLFNHFPASKMGQPLQGLNHGEDLYYEFDGSLLFPQDKFNAEDRQVERTFVSMLTDFAKTGDTTNALGGLKWPEYSLSNESYLSLSAQPKIERQMYGKRIALWSDLVPTLFSSSLVANGGDMGGTSVADKHSSPSFLLLFVITFYLLRHLPVVFS